MRERRPAPAIEETLAPGTTIVGVRLRPEAAAPVRGSLSESEQRCGCGHDHSASCALLRHRPQRALNG